MQYPCDRFAAFLAHCLNSEDFSSITVDAGSLYALLTDALSTRYAQPMLHHPGYAWRMSAEEAAVRYFEVSVQRPLQLSPRVRISIAQRLLEALCHRGAAPSWADASVARELQPPAGEPVPRAIPAGVQKEFGRCSQALSEVPDRISSGSPSPTLQARFGPVALRLYSLRARVPEEISLWDALVCAPRTLKSLPRGKSFNDFCCLLIDGIRTAHRPYQELVGLGRGLCPFDWMDVLSIQQARSLRKFVRILEETASVESQSGWERAWANAPVPGFRNASELWGSEIGMALRQPRAHGSAHGSLLENLADPDSMSGEQELLQEDTFEHAVEILVSRGVIHAVERTVLTALYCGRTRTEILALPGVQDHLKTSALQYERFLESLQQRIEEWADSRQEGDHEH